jgi:hypothetical protein
MGVTGDEEPVPEEHLARFRGRGRSEAPADLAPVDAAGDGHLVQTVQEPGFTEIQDKPSVVTAKIRRPAPAMTTPPPLDTQPRPSDSRVLLRGSGRLMRETPPDPGR